MPFAFKLKLPATKARAGGAKQKRHVSSGPVVSQVSPSVNPTLGAPVQPAQLTQGLKTVNTETITLGTTATQAIQGQTYNLPLIDIIALEFQISITSVTGSFNATDFAKLIDHIQIADGSGHIFANIPGGTFVYDNYTRYNTPPPTTVLSNTIASGATSGTATLVYHNTRTPAASGGETGCQLTVYYTATAPSSATALVFTNRIQVRFGNCQGYKTRYANQNITLASGDNLLQTNSVPQSNLISELFIRTLGTATYLNYVRIQTNNVVIEQQLYESQIAQRDKDRFYGSFEADTLVLAEPGQWAMNSTSEFDVNMSSAVTGAQFVWVWYEPA